ncbi:hypothetical protein LR48_Vigan205s000900 [Vigna angularis]|uniref:Uncharacterized protein n=1 Tax=Phaseolus angularis TaxID=3914 RepID=A0A0L9T5L9_PHAAN|nr:hypothetical protein LR48_Vigan205s000900 [Vigna angularis]
MPPPPNRPPPPSPPKPPNLHREQHHRASPPLTQALHRTIRNHTVTSIMDNQNRAPTLTASLSSSRCQHQSATSMSPDHQRRGHNLQQTTTPQHHNHPFRHHWVSLSTIVQPFFFTSSSRLADGAVAAHKI